MTPRTACRPVTQRALVPHRAHRERVGHRLGAAYNVPWRRALRALLLGWPPPFRSRAHTLGGEAGTHSSSDRATPRRRRAPLCHRPTYTPARPFGQCCIADLVPSRDAPHYETALYRPNGSASPPATTRRGCPVITQSCGLQSTRHGCIPRQSSPSGRSRLVGGGHDHQAEGDVATDGQGEMATGHRRSPRGDVLPICLD